MRKFEVQASFVLSAPWFFSFCGFYGLLEKKATRILSFRLALPEQFMIKIESLGRVGLCWVWGMAFGPNPRSAMGWFTLVI